MGNITLKGCEKKMQKELVRLKNVGRNRHNMNFDRRGITATIFGYPVYDKALRYFIPLVDLISELENKFY